VRVLYRKEKDVNRLQLGLEVWKVKINIDHHRAVGMM